MESYSASSSSDRAAPPTPTSAAADISAAHEARASFAAEMALPAGYSLVTGLGYAALAFGVALGNSEWRFGSLAFVVSLLATAAASAIGVRMFKARNGAALRGPGGLDGPRSTWPVLAAFLVGYVACIVGATWLMVAGYPALSALLALSLVPAAHVADRRWLDRYRSAR
jgi:membrane protein implicated in regulation of membrane protease activity